VNRALWMAYVVPVHGELHGYTPVQGEEEDGRWKRTRLVVDEPEAQPVEACTGS